jgi:hypothetical protein
LGPVIVIPEIVSVVGRLFFTVTVLAALVVPTAWLAYRRLAGVTYIQVETGARYCDTQAGDTDDQSIAMRGNLINC